jgi:hypothetical protein
MIKLTEEVRCKDPTAIQPWELEAYLDGIRAPHVVEHLANCLSCRQWVAEAEALELRLKGVLNRALCPSPSRLQAFIYDHLSPNENKAVRTHVATCPLCQKDLRELDNSISEEGMGNSIADWTRAREAVRHSGLVIPHWVMPKSPMSTPILRGETREVLLFESDECAVSINVEEEETGAFTLFGQVLTQAPTLKASGLARIISASDQSGNRFVNRASIDDTGSFMIPMLQKGTYQLVVDLDVSKIVIPGLRLR